MSSHKKIKKRDFVYIIKSILRRQTLSQIDLINISNLRLRKNVLFLFDCFRIIILTKTLQKKNIILQNEFIDQKFALRTMKQKLKILKTIHDRTRNVKKFITSSFVFSSSANHVAEITADINASNRLEKTKRSVVISNSAIFIKDKAKFEH